MLSPVMPVYFLPWDIVMYQVQPWKTDGDILTYAHASPSEEPRSKSNHTSGETGELSTRSGLPYLASYAQVGSMQMAEAACSPGCRRDETRLRLRPRRWPLSPLRPERAQSYSTYVACGSRKSDFQLCHLVHSMCNGVPSPRGENK